MNMEYNISFCPENSRLYQVQSRMTKGDKKQQLSYECKMTAEKSFFETTYTFERTLADISPKIDNPLLEAITLSNGLWSRLKLLIDKKGIITKLYDYPTIQQYWADTLKVQLTEMYMGGAIDNMVSQLEQLMTDRALFIQKISQDEFFYHLLDKCCGEYRISATTGKYAKVDRNYRLGHDFDYEIEKSDKGEITVKGIGKKSDKSLDLLKEQWGLALEHPLGYDEQISYVSKGGALLSMQKNEVYTYMDSVYLSNHITITSK